MTFLWLEITGRCQLECTHCYAGSSPAGDHGTMTTPDWLSVLDQAADLGVSMVQFIGGEPTLHPSLPELVRHALSHGLRVEVFSNLVHVTDELWDVFALPGVSLATSYYSDDPAEHAAITGRPSHARTRANIAKAQAKGIPLRAGVIDLADDQRADQAHDELVNLGVPEVGRDRLREVGRGGDGAPGTVDQLCGRCGQGTAAVSPEGSVWPCVFSRWLPVGDVRDDTLVNILEGATMRETAGALAAHFATRETMGPCDPKCGPNCGPACLPQCWPTGSGPCGPKGGCQPNYG
ncbi:radical SAM/SPASM domain-containing protein [Prauserella halophila]|uniref:radical SAM/SPASM domain-containing protein n=1 Tax=Prauserella halophila TaxID=185641 RepID=UPI0020A35094|nr:radical SAM protein [Prauserella halophila]